MKYIVPQMKIFHFQAEIVNAAEVVSYIPPLQELINNDEDFAARMESFTKLIEYK